MDIKISDSNIENFKTACQLGHFFEIKKVVFPGIVPIIARSCHVCLHQLHFSEGTSHLQHLIRMII